MNRNVDTWRVNAETGPVDLEAAGKFDELVVGRWIHVEMMNERSAFVSLGTQAFWVAINKDGTGRIVTQEDRSCGECGRLDALGCHARTCEKGKVQAKAARLALRHRRP